MSSPQKQTDGRSVYTSSATSRVIDQLQSKIDQLSGDLNETKESLRESKQKNSILRKRNDDLVEQLSNAKHESDMSEALLKRKERRVADLEAQLTEALSKADNLQFESHDMRKKVKMLMEKEEMAVSECERLKVSYDAIVTAQNEYKRLMGKRVSDLEQKLYSFVDDRKKTLDSNMDLLKRQEPEIMASYKVVVKNSERLEEMYAQRQQSVSQALVALAGATKTHGEKTGIVMAECEDVLKQMNRNEELMARLRNSNGDSDTEEDIRKFNDERATHELSSAHNEEHSQTDNAKNHLTMAEERRRSDSSMRHKRGSMTTGAEAGDIREQDDENKENLKRKVFRDISMDEFETGRANEKRNSRRRERSGNYEHQRLSSTSSFSSYNSFEDTHGDSKLVLPKQRNGGARKGSTRIGHTRNKSVNVSGNWNRGGYGNGSANGNETGSGSSNSNRNSSKGGGHSRRGSSQRRSGRGSRGGHNRGNRRSFVQLVSSRD